MGSEQLLKRFLSNIYDIHANITKLCLIFCLSLYIINLGYLFDGSFIPLKNHDFVSSAFTGLKSGETGNRFKGTLLGELPIPLPEQFILGLDSQKKDFEGFHQESYLRGQWSKTGWWYYYLYGMLVKVPHVTQLMILVGFLYLIYRLATSLLGYTTHHSQASLADIIVLITPGIALFILASSQTAFSIHFRYVFPCFGFFFILAALAANDLFSQTNLKSWVVILLLASSINTMKTFPYYISYFNELSGGPESGYKHMLGSSFNWGQNFRDVVDFFHNKRLSDNHVCLKKVLYKCKILYFDIKVHTCFPKEIIIIDNNDRDEITCLCRKYRIGVSHWIYK